MAKVLTKNSFTPGSAPPGLSAGELAVNVADKKLFVGNAVGGVVTLHDQQNVVTSVNGITGAITNVARTNEGNTFSVQQVMNAGITSANLYVTGGSTFAGDIAVNGGDITTSAATVSVFDDTSATTATAFRSASTLTFGATTGTTTVRNNLTTTLDLAVNGGDITTTSTSATVFNATATTLNIGSAATGITLGATTGTLRLKNPTVYFGNTTGTLSTTTSGSSNHLYLNPYGKVIINPTTNLLNAGTIPSVTIENTDQATGVVEISGGDLYLGIKTADDLNYTPVSIIFEGGVNNTSETTLTVAEPTADRTITLPDATTTVAGLSVAQTFTQLQQFNAGISAANGITFNSAVNFANTFTINGAQGTNGQVLSSTGSGITWSTPSGGGLSWSATTADATMAVDNGYLANKSTGTLTLTLPTTSAVGKVIRVSGMQNTWRIAQNALQKINFGKTTSTTGTGGYIESTNARDAVELVCCVANTEWNVISSIGNITIV